MTLHKSARHAIKYNDEDIITDTVFGEDNTEYVVTMKGHEWRNYDWIIENAYESALRMADFTHFVYLNNKSECTHSMTLAHGAKGFKELRQKRRGSETYDVDPKNGTVGSA